MDVGVLFPLLLKVFITFCSCPLKEFVGDPSVADGLVEGSPRDVDLMSPPSPVPPWVQWSNELAREMYIKRALSRLQLQYPDDS